MVFATRDGAAGPLEAAGPSRDRRWPGSGRRQPAPSSTSTSGTRWPTRSPNGSSPRRGGNPLALLELPTELDAAQLRGSSPLPAQLHLTARVERVFLDRSRRLSADVQSVLLLAAADDTGDRHRAQACGRVPRSGRAMRWTAAVASGLVVEDGVGRRRAPPAGPLGDLPGRDGCGQAPRAPGAGRGPGRRGRPRPGDLASRRCCRRPGRRPWSPPWSSSGPEHSVAAGMPLPWRPSSVRQP